MKTIIAVITILLFIGVICCKSPDTTPCPTKTCADYKTQPDAQAAFNADKICLSSLDNDNDGIACEQLPSSTTPPAGCPTTANCGCSGKTQAQCTSSCCKWVVGTGCVCK